MSLSGACSHAGGVAFLHGGVQQELGNLVPFGKAANFRLTMIELDPTGRHRTKRRDGRAGGRPPTRLIVRTPPIAGANRPLDQRRGDARGRPE